jgi:hypothetical protein
MVYTSNTHQLAKFELKENLPAKLFQRAPFDSWLSIYVEIGENLISIDCT